MPDNITDPISGPWKPPMQNEAKTQSQKIERSQLPRRAVCRMNFATKIFCQKRQKRHLGGACAKITEHHALWDCYDNKTQDSYAY